MIGKRRRRRRDTRLSFPPELSIARHAVVRSIYVQRGDSSSSFCAKMPISTQTDQNALGVATTSHARLHSCSAFARLAKKERRRIREKPRAFSFPPFQLHNFYATVYYVYVYSRYSGGGCLCRMEARVDGNFRNPICPIAKKKPPTTTSCCRFFVLLVVYVGLRRRICGSQILHLSNLDFL